MIVMNLLFLSVLYACVFYFCICTCSAQLSMFHMEKCSRNTLIIIIKCYRSANKKKSVSVCACINYKKKKKKKS